MSKQADPSNDVECTTGAAAPKKIGDVGYEFLREFEDAWFIGEVVQIREAVDSDKEEEFRRNRRCAYEDRDFEEDLSLHDLKRQLAKFEKLSRSSSVNEAENPVAEIKLGDVGYTFEKEFSVGWFHGEVVEILEEVKGKSSRKEYRKDRRCFYEDDGYIEDLSLHELRQLAKIEMQKQQSFKSPTDTDTNSFEKKRKRKSPDEDIEHNGCASLPGPTLSFKEKTSQLEELMEPETSNDHGDTSVSEIDSKILVEELLKLKTSNHGDTSVSEIDSEVLVEEPLKMKTSNHSDASVSEIDSEIIVDELLKLKTSNHGEISVPEIDSEILVEEPLKLKTSNHGHTSVSEIDSEILVHADAKKMNMSLESIRKAKQIGYTPPTNITTKAYNVGKGKHESLSSNVDDEAAAYGRDSPDQVSDDFFAYQDRPSSSDPRSGRAQPPGPSLQDPRPYSHPILSQNHEVVANTRVLADPNEVKRPKPTALTSTTATQSEFNVLIEETNEEVIEQPTAIEMQKEAHPDSSITPQQFIPLQVWFKQNSAHPFPTEEEKKSLAEATGLHPHLVDGWFKAAIRVRRKELETVIHAIRSGVEMNIIDCKTKQRPFPYRLRSMIDSFSLSAAIDGSVAPLEWLPGGRSFVIADPGLLALALPKFFDSIKLRSFMRQLNLWGFQRDHSAGMGHKHWFHPHFLLDGPSLMALIERTPIKGCVDQEIGPQTFTEEKIHPTIDSTNKAIVKATNDCVKRVSVSKDRTSNAHSCLEEQRKMSNLSLQQYHSHNKANAESASPASMHHSSLLYQPSSLDDNSMASHQNSYQSRACAAKSVERASDHPWNAQKQRAIIDPDGVKNTMSNVDMNTSPPAQHSLIVPPSDRPINSAITQNVPSKLYALVEVASIHKSCPDAD